MKGIAVSQRFPQFYRQERLLCGVRCHPLERMGDWLLLLACRDVKADCLGLNDIVGVGHHSNGNVGTLPGRAVHKITYRLAFIKVTGGWARLWYPDWPSPYVMHAAAQQYQNFDIVTVLTFPMQHLEMKGWEGSPRFQEKYWS